MVGRAELLSTVRKRTDDSFTILGAMEVVGIGSCAVDYVAQVPRLLGPDEKINANRLEIHPGGVTANNLTQVARLGASAGWLGLLGDDDNGRFIQDAFRGDRMDLSGITILPGARSSMTWIPIDAAGERSIYMFPNVTGTLTPAQVSSLFAAPIRLARHFHTEASQLPLAPIDAAIRIARQAGVRVLFDLDVAPSFFAQMGLGSEAELVASLAAVDVLKPCKAAARELTGETDFVAIGRRLLTFGPTLVALTMGGEGSILATDDEIVAIPAFQVEVVDTTGAGDAFMGGLSYGLLQGWDLRQIGRFANACAALCCTKLGARACATRDVVQAFLDRA
jgi:sugar/nucleoside kinase (ribokinase family)